MLSRPRDQLDGGAARLAVASVGSEQRAPCCARLSRARHLSPRSWLAPAATCAPDPHRRTTSVSLSALLWDGPEPAMVEWKGTVQWMASGKWCEKKRHERRIRDKRSQKAVAVGVRLSQINVEKLLLWTL
eukprot:307125-Rhodomonas_salina.2